MNSVARLTSIWEDLGKKDDALPGLMTRYDAESTDEIWVGLTFPDHKPFIRIHIASEEIPKIDRGSVLSGVEIIIERVLGKNGCETFDLVLTEKAYSEIFKYFVSDLIRALQNRAAVRIRTVLSRNIEQWKSFLSVFRQEGLSRKELLGLWGELVFLQQLILHSALGCAATQTWFGPQKELHDFAFSDFDAEIKTHTNSNFVVISNERQLSVDDKALALITLFVATSHSAQSTVPVLVSEIRGLLLECPESLSHFNFQLLKASYFDIQSHNYESRSFSLKRSRAFTVGQEFPRLTSEHLPEGINDVSYKLELDFCSVWETNLETILKKV